MTRRTRECYIKLLTESKKIIMKLKIHIYVYKNETPNRSRAAGYLR
ncbi:MAG TPA: hypothetical protein VJI15_03520 [Candidatus Nanoarchaeia archaeon]|nr:hypothetical protein [Candidatus Nanoarchaeia archaeon]